MYKTVTEFLKAKVSLFKGLSEARILEIVKASRVVYYEVNESVIRLGEEATFLGVILEGELKIAGITEDGFQRQVGFFSKGDTFGEMALMSRERIIADLIASKPCKILRIPVEVFQSVLMSEPTFLQHVSKTIIERMKQLTEDPKKASLTFRKSDETKGILLKGERPEKILVINSGSSSIKFAFFDSEKAENKATGQVERIGMSGTLLSYKGPKGDEKTELETGGYIEALHAVIKVLSNKKTGVIKTQGDISVVGHRMVHGGEKYSQSIVVTDDILVELEKLNPLAPLHNPVNIAGIREARKVFPSVPHVAVFDTAFHSTLPSYAYLYGLPYEYYEKYGVRRYGFHGSSHSYVCLKASQFLQKRVNELKIASCHLGNGASIAAVEHGRSVDTTMGFTPGEGLIMGTRSGDLDPGVITYLQREEGLSGVEIDQLLNRKSGLLGLSGISGDMREIEQAAENGNTRALVTLKAFSYRIRKYIGAYMAAMGGTDVVIFTGGIGQGSAGVRSLALQGLQCMGIHLDDQRNREANGFAGITRISTDDSPVTVLIVPSDEERMIARETLRAISRSYLREVAQNQQNEPFLLEVSAHHIHLSQEHVEALFGPGHQLTWHSDLSQPGQFACKEQLTVVGPKGNIERLRVLGPVRNETQIEISMTEQFKLGIHPPIRESGNLNGTPGCTLEGPAGTVTIEKGVICALRHIHMHPEDALKYGVKDKATVRVRVKGDRELVFGDVLIRVNPSYKLAMHIDTDEANAASLKTGDLVYIDGIQHED